MAESTGEEMRNDVESQAYSDGCRLANIYVEHWWSPEHKYEWEDNLNEHRENLSPEQWDSFFSTPMSEKTGLQTFIELVEDIELQDRELQKDMDNPNAGTVIISAFAQAGEAFDRHVTTPLVASEEISEKDGKHFKNIVGAPDFLQGFADTIISRFRDALGDVN